MQADTQKRRKRIVRNPGLCAFARQQGVTVVHAWRVVIGERRSDRLLNAWQVFKATQSNPQKP